MLDKYQHFLKISKSSQCSIYSAYNRQTTQDVLIKRIETEIAWNSVLGHKNISVIKNNKQFLKIIEILRHKGSFFMVYEKPYGHSLQLSKPIEKLQLQSAFVMFADFLQGVNELFKINENPYLYPQWVYFHRNSLKIVHFQPFLFSQQTKKPHIFTHSFTTRTQPSSSEENSSSIPQKYKKLTIFHLGLIIYKLITNKKIEQSCGYEKTVAQIRSSCEWNVNRLTKDSKLANFISKMLSDNQFEVPSFTQVYNYFQSKMKQAKFRQPNKDIQIDISLEKIRIKTPRQDNQKKIKLRFCCERQRKISDIIQKDRLNNIGLKSVQHINSMKKDKLMLPYLSLGRVDKLKSKSLINRHNPLTAISKRYRQQKQTAKSFDYND